MVPDARPVEEQPKVIPPGWKQLRTAAGFSFYAPPDMHIAALEGIPIDSTLGAFANADFRLEFDYGRYSNTLESFSGDARYSTEAVTIDGRPGRIVTGPGLGDETWGCEGYVAATYAVDREERGSRMALEMHACAPSESSLPTIKSVFRTIDFQD